MRHVWKRVLALGLAIIMMLSLCGCAKKEDVRQVVKDFEYSCQNLDINAMLKCIDPSVAQPIQAILLTANALIGVNAQNVLEDAVDSVVETVFQADYEAEDFLRELSFEEKKISISGKKATYKGKIVYEIGGNRFQEDITISLIQKDDEWYISKIKLR